MSTDTCTKNRQHLQTVSGELLPRTPRINLSNLAHIRQEMSKVYREARNKTLDTAEATKLVYILGQIGKVYELEVIENRIAALEGKTGNGL